MKTQSAKAKGRRFQQWVRDILIEKLDVHPEDIESRSMGAGGEDLIMARAAREKFPYSIECKNQESLNIWKAYEQATENSGDYEPVCFIKRNNQKTIVVVNADYIAYARHQQGKGSIAPARLVWHHPYSPNLDHFERYRILFG